MTLSVPAPKELSTFLLKGCEGRKLSSHHFVLSSPSMGEGAERADLDRSLHVLSMRVCPHFMWDPLKREHWKERGGELMPAESTALAS